MEEKSERLDLRAEKHAGVMASGRKGRRARLIHTGLPKGHEKSLASNAIPFDMSVDSRAKLVN